MIPVERLRPVDLPEAKFDLGVFTDSPFGRDYYERFVESLGTAVGETASKETVRQAAMSLRLHCVRQCLEGAAFHVSGEMSDVCQKASESQPMIPFRPTDLPTEEGFIYLEKPFTVADDPDVPFVPVWAIGWSTYVPYSNDPEIKARAEKALGQAADEPGFTITLWGDLSSLPEGKDYVTHVREVYGQEVPVAFTFLHYQPMGFGEEWGNPRGVVPQVIRAVSVEGTSSAASSITRTQALFRFLRTIWIMMDQRIAASHRVGADRHSRKRMARRGHVPSEVSVVTLRRTTKPQAEDHVPGEVAWTHRWFVDGHWRRIHKGTTEERLVWVTPHVKGPEHLPLVAKTKVYHLTR